MRGAFAMCFFYAAGAAVMVTARVIRWDGPPTILWGGLLGLGGVCFGVALTLLFTAVFGHANRR